MSKVTKKFCMSYSNSVKCQAILLELALPYFAMNKIFVQFLFINSMKLDFLILSRIELETFCVYGRHDNRYTRASELTQVASFSCFACRPGIFAISAFFENYGKFSHVLMKFRHVSGNFSGVS